MEEWLRRVPICVDGRMSGAGGTGVSTYARALTTAVAKLTNTPYQLIARSVDDGRLLKWATVLRGAPRRLSIRNEPRNVLEGRDIFRRAHVHFGIHRRLYRLRCDLAPGIMHWTYPVPLIMETGSTSIPCMMPFRSIDPI